MKKFISELALERLSINDNDLIAVDNAVLENTYKMKAKLLLPRRVEFNDLDNVWEYESQLDYHPIVDVYNELGERVITSVTLLEDKTITVEFNQPTRGYIIVQ